MPYIRALIQPSSNKKKPVLLKKGLLIDSFKKNNVTLLPRHTRYPKLSPVVLDMIVSQLDILPQPSNSLVDFCQRIQEACDDISQDTINYIISSMHRRVIECLGDPIFQYGNVIIPYTHSLNNFFKLLNSQWVYNIQ